MNTATSSRVIALDGPSGSGKSTVARAVATALGLGHVDTGATYRAATLAVLRAQADLADPSAVADVVLAAQISLVTDPAAGGVFLAGKDVSAEIRGAAVTNAVSAVSAVAAVRRHLVALQRSMIGAGAVVEGRDIGTVVAPDAAVKVYLDAAPLIRAERRAGDVQAGVHSPVDLVSSVAVDLARRDRLDSTRDASPLQPAGDAAYVDSSSLSALEVVDQVLRLAAAAGIHP